MWHCQRSQLPCGASFPWGANFLDKSLYCHLRHHPRCCCCYHQPLNPYDTDRNYSWYQSEGTWWTWWETSLWNSLKVEKFVPFSGLFVGVGRWDFRGSSRYILLSTTTKVTYIKFGIMRSILALFFILFYIISTLALLRTFGVSSLDIAVWAVPKIW